MPRSLRDLRPIGGLAKFWLRIQSSICHYTQMKKSVQGMNEKLQVPKGAKLFAAVLWAACVPVAIAAVYQGIVFKNRRSAWREQRSAWESALPVYQSALEQQKRLETKRGFFYELGAWSRTRLNWFDVLKAVREQKPDGIHILVIQSEGELDDVAPPLSAREEIGRHYSLRMCCKSEASVTSQQIVDFVKSLRNVHAFNQCWSDIRMGNINIDKHHPESGRKVMCLDGYGEKRRFVRQ